MKGAGACWMGWKIKKCSPAPSPSSFSRVPNALRLDLPRGIMESQPELFRQSMYRDFSGLRG